MKLGTPFKHNNNLVQHLEVAKHSLNLTSKDDKQSCYKLNVDNIIGMGSTSALEVTITEKSIVDDRRFLRRATKEVAPGETATFRNEDF